MEKYLDVIICAENILLCLALLAIMIRLFRYKRIQKERDKMILASIHNLLEMTNDLRPGDDWEIAVFSAEERAREIMER